MDEGVAVDGAGVAEGGAVVAGLRAAHRRVHEGLPVRLGDGRLQRVLRAERRVVQEPLQMENTLSEHHLHIYKAELKRGPSYV